MAKGAKIITDFGELSDSLFYDASTLMFNSISKNIGDLAGFPVDMAIYQPQIEEFNKVRNAVDFPEKVAKTESFRTIVQKTITQNNNWFNTFCAGNVVLLKETGAPFQKEAEAQGVLGKTTLTLVPMPGGTKVDYFISHIKGGGIHYGLLVTLASNPINDPAEWKFNYCGSREGVMDGLLPKTDYKFVSFAMGTVSELTMSEVVNVTTL